MSKARHIPMRTCVACREIAPQASLVRVALAPGASLGTTREIGSVPTGSSIVLDIERRSHGRGAYVHPGLMCRGSGRGEDVKLASGLSRAFRRGVRPDDVGILRAGLLGASASDRDSVERRPQNKAKDDTGSRSKDARL